MVACPVSNNVHHYSGTAQASPYNITLTNCQIRIIAPDSKHYNEFWSMVVIGC